jgi:hypothetical protein
MTVSTTKIGGDGIARPARRPRRNNGLNVSEIASLQTLDTADFSGDGTLNLENGHQLREPREPREPRYLFVVAVPDVSIWHPQVRLVNEGATRREPESGPSRFGEDSAKRLGLQ